MIADKFVDRYARNSDLRDQLIAERDVVLTYALRALVDGGVMNHLAFRGGTCLRKLVFGSAGLDSRDTQKSSFVSETARRDVPISAGADPGLIPGMLGEHLQPSAPAAPGAVPMTRSPRSNGEGVYR